VNPNWLKGEAWLTMVSTENPFNTPIANVTFAPAARNHWYSHNAGQILLVTGSECLFIRKNNRVSINKLPRIESPKYSVRILYRFRKFQIVDNTDIRHVEKVGYRHTARPLFQFGLCPVCSGRFQLRHDSLNSVARWNLRRCAGCAPVASLPVAGIFDTILPSLDDIGISRLF
jgi:hypothetical protein